MGWHFCGGTEEHDTCGLYLPVSFGGNGTAGSSESEYSRNQRKETGAYHYAHQWLQHRRNKKICVP